MWANFTSNENTVSPASIGSVAADKNGTSSDGKKKAATSS
jgi:hypothetical protein